MICDLKNKDYKDVFECNKSSNTYMRWWALSAKTESTTAYLHYLWNWAIGT
jgi:hypothetical protein